MATRELISAVILAAVATWATSCTGSESTLEPDPPSVRGAGETIPITTRSDDAYDLYVEGRRLAERIRPTEARELYLQALGLDRHFALAHLALANSSVSAREFFESMERALALSDVVSEGERLMILAQDAGMRGEPDEQLELLARLVEAYPDDPRAHVLLAGNYGGRQDFEKAIASYETAVDLDPEFSSAFNNLGYLYRAMERYVDAEAAFERYVELIPDEPNPYDSYAELLMKVGRFEESIAAYEKALEIKPDFLFSLRGIGHDLVFLDRFEEAREVFAHQYELAEDLGQRRGALFWTAMSYLHEGEVDAALATLDRMSDLSEADGDVIAVAGDQTTAGQILAQAGRFDAAEERFDRALELAARSDVPDEVKENNRRNDLYRRGRLSIGRGDLDAARGFLATYAEQVETRRIPFEERRVHELSGEIALAAGDAETAVKELTLASQQNSRVLYLRALALRQAGHLDEAVAAASKAAEFNTFGLNFAFVRRPARALVAELGG